MISLFRYRIPFKQPFQLAGTRLLEREGFIIRYETDSLDVYSEIAPLPDFSPESTDAVLNTLFGNINEIELHLKTPDSDSWYDWLHGSSFPPSIRFGLDVLRQQSTADKSSIALHTLLNPHAGTRLGTNAVLGILPSDELVRQTDRLVTDGYRTVKFKVADPETNVEDWKHIRTKHPQLNMRFDANGSWPLDKASKWAKLLEPIGPDYLEQPLAVGLESQMASLQRDLSYPIAFDESARNIDSVRSILAESRESVLILKPMLIGSIRELSDIITEIRTAGSAFTITTLLESGIGRNTVASLASAFSAHDIDHGLGTGSLFAEDILADLGIIDGMFMIDNHPTSRLDRTKLETFRIH